MGSSAPKSETVVKGGKPVILREYDSPQYLQALGGMSEHWQRRAQGAAATRQSNLNHYLSHYGVAPVYKPYTTSTGSVIEPYQAPDVYNTSDLVKAAQESGMFKLPKGKGKVKNKEPREAYADALTAGQLNRSVTPQRA